MKYRYELHMHTKEGSACAVDTIEDMIKQYSKWMKMFKQISYKKKYL